MEDAISKIKELQEKIKACNNDKIAIDLQSQIVKLLLDTLKDKNKLKELIKNNLYNGIKKD